MATHPKHVNHELSAMACPVHLDDVDLFGDGRSGALVRGVRDPAPRGPGATDRGRRPHPGADAFVLTKHADVSRVVKDPERFLSLTQATVGGSPNRDCRPRRPTRPTTT